jgi:hypothetical protein
LERVSSILPEVELIGGPANNYKMLVKWAIEARRKTAKDKPSTNENDRHGVEPMSAPRPISSFSANPHPRTPGASVESETTAQALTAELDRLHYQSDAAFARTEDEGERAMRRIHAEERDTKLRDEKLLSLVGPQLIRHNSSQPRESDDPSMPLTEANIEKLVHEQDGDSPITRKVASPDEIDSTNASNAHSMTMSNNRQSTLSRPGLQERHRESEQTVTERMAK